MEGVGLGGERVTVVVHLFEKLVLLGWGGEGNNKRKERREVKLFHLLLTMSVR